MANLKDLKNRIASVKSTRQITQAMQMVAAAKLRRAQEAAENARPYTERMEAVIASLASAVAGSEGAPRLLAGTGRDETHLIVVMTAERGLCGGFNSSIVRRARALIAELEGQGKTVKILTVGKKGREQLNRQHAAKFVDHVDLGDVRRIGYADARGIADDIMARFAHGEFDVATIVFNTFKNVMTQVPTASQVIPADFEDTEAETGTVHEYEPSEEVILRDLLPQGVTTQIFAALLENAASEQGARMTAMDSATRNADQMIDDLTIQYNRTRQAVITNELIEIISGAEAL